MGLAITSSTGGNRPLMRNCKRVFVNALVVVCLFFSCGRTAERNYDAVKGAGIVWRSRPIANVCVANKTFEFNFSQLHKDLKRYTQEDRKQLTTQIAVGNVLKPEKGNGNCATACLSIIYADGKREDSLLVPKILNNSGFPKGFGLNGFTTLKASSARCRNGVGITRGAPNTLGAVRKLSNKEIATYLDAELQIVHELYFSRTPQMETLLNSTQQKGHKNTPVVLIVLHIYSELDPCGWCGEILSAFTKKVNQDMQTRAWGAGDHKNQPPRFMVMTSSSQACHRSREIGLDPVFMDAELSKLPITINFADIPLPQVIQVTVIPQNFVIFTPDADIKDFPLIRIKTPSGVSIYSLLNNEEKDFEKLRPQTHAQTSTLQASTPAQPAPVSIMAVPPTVPETPIFGIESLQKRGES